eukprot:2006644-Prymnesium_polylepis.1
MTTRECPARACHDVAGASQRVAERYTNAQRRPHRAPPGRYEQPREHQPLDGGDGAQDPAAGRLVGLLRRHTAGELLRRRGARGCGQRRDRRQHGEAVEDVQGSRRVRAGRPIHAH